VSVVGLKVKLDIDHDRPCCRNVCIVSAGKEPNARALHCADCGQHRGRLSKSTPQWIEHVVTRYDARIVLTRSSFAFLARDNGVQIATAAEQVRR
jgi:hypothetical protein